VAGVALGDMDRHFVWQAWLDAVDAASFGVAGLALGEPSLCVVGVAFGDMDGHDAANDHEEV